MEDFITNIHEKEICTKCDFEYLKSEFCKNCCIDTYTVEKSLTWFENEDFKKFALYEGLNLGEFIDYDLKRILLKAIYLLVKDTK